METMPDVGVAFVNHVQVKWEGEQRFVAGRPGSASVRIDARAQTGPSPVDTLLIALGTCTAVDVVEILAKRRTPVQSMHMEVDGARADAVPKRLVGVLLTYYVTGPGIERVHAERAIELAVTKYCSVRDSLDPNLPVRWKLVLNGE
jgi:putative redox protein